MAEAQRVAPSPPAAKPVGKSAEEFSAFKEALAGIPPWDATPNTWDKIQICYINKGNEQQAKGFLKAIELPSPEM
ncbi:MAG: hypothetical protein N3G22_02270 [Candidatus Micrarchaeota archaeon]|nr:hypothetical protein [Candidatus Micrarchaeota archaeon]